MHSDSLSLSQVYSPHPFFLLKPGCSRTDLFSRMFFGWLPSSTSASSSRSSHSCCFWSASASRLCILSDDSGFWVSSVGLFPMFLCSVALSVFCSMVPSFFLYSVGVNSSLFEIFSDQLNSMPLIMINLIPAD